MQKRNLLLVAGGMLMLAGCGQKQAEVQNNQTAKEAVEETVEMGKAIESGEPVVCTMTTDDGMELIYKLKGGKVKAEGVWMGDGSRGNLINDLTYMYTWKDGESQGMKVSLKEGEKMVKEAQPEEKEKVEEEVEVLDYADKQAIDKYKQQGYQVDCEERTVDDSEFVPPTTVNFVDPQAMMEKALEQMKGAGAENMPEDVKEQLEQLKGQM